MGVGLASIELHKLEHLTGKRYLLGGREEGTVRRKGW